LHAEEAHPLLAVQRFRQLLIAALLFIFAHHQQVAVGRRDGADRRIQSLALKAGADVDQAGRLARQIPFGAQRDKGFFRRRQKTLVIDSVIDNVDFFRRQAEVFNNLAFNHLRVADNAAQVRVLVHVALGLHHIAMVAVGKQQAAFPAGQNARALLQPAAVHAVSGAVQVAAGDTLVALHQIEGFALP